MLFSGTIIGYIGNDATRVEEKYMDFSVAVIGKKGEETTWVQVRSYYNDKLVPYLRKGALVNVQGKVSISAYAKDGEAKASVSLWASEINLLPTSKTAEASASAAQQPIEESGKPEGFGAPWS